MHQAFLSLSEYVLLSIPIENFYSHFLKSKERAFEN